MGGFVYPVVAGLWETARMTLASVSRKLREWYDFPAACDEHECMYAECDLIVPPHKGYRSGGAVFCGHEHARLDQYDALI